jgi:hypothetical protein
LDENGLCPAKTTTCWVPKDYYKLTGATATMKADLNAFLLFHAQHYFSVIRSAVNAVAPGIMYLGPASMGSWGTPPYAQILQAAGQYVDVLGFNSSAPPDCQNCTDKQQRVDFTAQNGGDKPWTSWDLFAANADAYTSPWALSSDWFKTQAARGQYYQNRMMPQTFNACDTSTVTCHNVGESFWALYDNCVEHQNWGLATPRDDPYDGTSASTSQGYDAWGYPTGCLRTYGCEQASYGDFLSYVRAGNLWVLRSLVAAPL